MFMGRLVFGLFGCRAQDDGALGDGQHAGVAVVIFT